MPFDSRLDANQVIRKAYNDATGRLKVEGSFGSGGTPIEVIIDHADDSIRLGDGTKLVTATQNGSKVGIDVNLTNDEISGAAIYNIQAIAANTEYTFTLPANTKKFTLRNRQGYKMNLSFTSGSSGTNFITVSRGTNYSVENIHLLNDVPLYFRTNKPSSVVEILVWS